MCLCGCTKKNQEGQLSKIYKVPQKLIYINAPSTYEETQNGYSKIYFVKNKKYIAITAEKSMEATELTKAQDIVFSKIKENVKDLDDVPQEVKDAVTFIPCSNVSQVLHNALVK